MSSADPGRHRRAHPLRRRVDLVEARILLFIGGAVLLGAPAIGVTAGWSAYAHNEAVADTQNAARHHVRAEVLVDAASSVPWADETERSAKVPVMVRWNSADGTRGTGTVPVPPGTERGERTDMWLDRDGRIAAPPLNQSDVLTGALAEGTGSSALVVAAGAVTGLAVRATCNRRRACGWASEWNRVEPEWSRRRT